MDTPLLRACQKYKENIIIDFTALTELYDRLSQAKCQHCDKRLVLPTADDDIGLWVANDRYSTTSTSRSVLNFCCQNCGKSTGACFCTAVPSQRGCLIRSTDHFGFCLHISSDPYEGDLPRLFALWCVLLRIELHFRQISHGESSFKVESEVNWDFLVTGPRGHKLELLLQLLEDLIDARPSVRQGSPVEISILRLSSVFSYMEGVLESACAAKFGRSEAYYSSIVQFLTVVAGDTLLRELIFEPRLRTSYRGGLLSPVTFAIDSDAFEEYLANRLIGNIERLFKELLFYDTHRQSVSQLRWDKALPELHMVDRLYKQVSTTNVPLVIEEPGAPLGVWPWGHQFSWDDAIFKNHWFRGRSSRCPNMKDAHVKRTGLILDSIRGMGIYLPPGVFVKASMKR
jgi:hypothetical protein